MSFWNGSKLSECSWKIFQQSLKMKMYYDFNLHNITKNTVEIKKLQAILSIKCIKLETRNLSSADLIPIDEKKNKKPIDNVLPRDDKLISCVLYVLDLFFFLIFFLTHVYLSISYWEFIKKDFSNPKNFRLINVISRVIKWQKNIYIGWFFFSYENKYNV